MPRESLEEIFGSTATPKNEFSGVTKQGAPDAPYYVPTGAGTPGSEGTGTGPKQTLEEIFGPAQPEGSVKATSQKGADVLQGLTALDPDVDYSKPAPLTVRFNVSRASNPTEVEDYLKGQYGEGNFRQDGAGNWLVREMNGWVPVHPKGGLQNVATNAAVGMAATAPEVLGGVAGGVAGGAVGGPAGAIVGSGLGSGGGKIANEAAKAAQGFFNKTPGEAAGEVGAEASMGAAFAAMPTIARALMNSGRGMGAAVGRYVGGISPETRGTLQELGQFADETALTDPKLGNELRKVAPPIGGYAPGATSLEYDRTLRNSLKGMDPQAERRGKVIDARMGNMLKQFGLPDDAVARAVADISDTSNALSGKQVGEALRGAVRGRETALLQEERANKDEAMDIARRSLQQITDRTRRPLGNLGQDIGAHVTGLRRAFSADMNRAYRNVTAMTGDQPVVRTDDVAREAQRLMETIPPESVPPIIRRLAQRIEPGIDDAPVPDAPPMTFEEAHNLRTTLREMANTVDLSPIGARRGNLSRMAGMLDAAMGRAEGQVGQDAAQALRELDRTYAAGIQRFTNSDVNSLIRDMRDGRTPNAGEVANLLIDKGSTDATRQVFSMLTPDMQTRVRMADMNNMFGAASRVAKDGRETLDGLALMRMLDKRSDVNEFLYPPGYTDGLRRLAREFAAIDGDLDITGLAPGQVRSALERAIGARRALDEEAAKNPLFAMKSNDPDMVDAAARAILKPGSTARTEEAYFALNPGARNATMPVQASPEWDAVQKFAITDLLKSAVRPKQGLQNRKVLGGDLEQTLAGYTARQKELLFGNRLPDILKLAKEAKLMFPETGAGSNDFGASLAAATIKGNMPWTVMPYAYRMVAGWVADRPQLMHWLIGEMDRSPIKGRGIFNVLLNFAAANYGNHAKQMREPEAGIMPELQPTQPSFQQFMGIPPTPTPARSKSLRGPL